MTFKTKGRRGLNSKRITVYSNDPSQPQVHLTVSAQLEVGLDLETRSVNFGNVLRGEGAVRSVKLVGRDAGATKLVSATFEPLRAGGRTPTPGQPTVQARIVETPPPGRVELSITPEAPMGAFAGKLTVRTDHAESSELMLRVQGAIRGSVTFQPDRLTFTGIGDGVPRTQTLTATSTSGKPLEILQVESNHPAVTAAVAPSANGRTKITVTCDGKPRRNQKTKLIVHTSSPEDPLIEVPVMIYTSGLRPQRPAQPVQPAEPKPTGAGGH